MGKAVFYSENSVMSPFVGAVAFQRESMMEKGHLKTADVLAKPTISVYRRPLM
jgi:hypothetical protein